MTARSNWPGDIDLSHTNFTGRVPRVSRYAGMGGWKEDSARIPKKAWAGGALVVALVFALAYVGSWSGF
ncbi:MAG: hypothetical protein WBF88_17675 [Pusillimonas sp.]